ncbi:unnamed protein product [Sphagnum jensenii]|uniref:Uncharacterized protein n=1 Tax=Sphagnum jensenii TaxID=128206 RepID=A0ABP0VTI1_9BRYO
MSTIDLLTRVSMLCKKYEKYDTEKLRLSSEGVASHDHFLKLYTSLEQDLADALEKSSDAEMEKNRAVVATLNAEVRRAKAAMRKEIPKLIRLATKKVKGVSADDLATRPDLALGLQAKIEAITDGVSVGHRNISSPKKSTPLEIKIDSVSPDDIKWTEQKEHSEESRNLQQDVELRQHKQDQNLETISEGLTTLKNMAEDIGEVCP